MKHAREQRPPDRTALNQFANLSMAGRVSQMVVGGQEHTGLLAGFQHGQSVVQPHRQRFLAQHLFACGRRRQHLVTVQFIGGADVNHLYGGISQQRINSAVSLRNVVLLRKRSTSFCIAAAHRNDVVPGLGTNGSNHVFAGNVAGAYQAPTGGGIRGLHWHGCEVCEVAESPFIWNVPIMSVRRYLKEQ